MPIGVWSTSSTRADVLQRRGSRSQPSSAAARALGAARPRAGAAGSRSSTSRASVDLPLPRHAGDARPAAPAECARRRLAGCAARADDLAAPASSRSTARARLQRMPQRLRAGSGRSPTPGCAISSATRALRPPRARRALPAPGPRSMTWSARRIVSSSCSTTTSVLPLALQLLAACRAASGCRADAGRWSARRACSRRRAGSSRAAPRAGCAAPRRRRASARRGRARGSQADVAQEAQARLQSRRACRARSRASRPRSFELREECRASSRDRQRGQLGDRPAAEPHRAAPRVAAAAPSQAGQARRLRRSSHSFHQTSSPVCSVVEVRSSCRPGAEAARAPAVLRVEREQARIELGEAAAAVRAGALGGEHLRGARAAPIAASASDAARTPLPKSSAASSAARSSRFARRR